MAQHGFDVTRRSMLGTLARGSAVAAALAEVKKGFARTIEPLSSASAAQPADWREDGGYWAKVRKQFMLEEGFAYLNTGTLGPTPAPVFNALRRQVLLEPLLRTRSPSPETPRKETRSSAMVWT